MKKLGVFLAASVLFLTTAAIADDSDRTVTIEEVRKAVSNRLEQTEGPKEWYQVWVGIIPITDYLRDGVSPLTVFSGCEVKISKGKFYKNELLSSGKIITRMRFDVLAATFNMDISIYLDPLTNNAVAFYYENRKTQTLTRLRIEEFDSLLEQLSNEYYGDGINIDGDQYNTTLYCVIDGRIIDPDCKWFCAGDGTWEAHVNRSSGSITERTKDYPHSQVWWPIEGKWLEELPDWLHIPTKAEIDYVRDGTTPFWEYIRRRQSGGQ